MDTSEYQEFLAFKAMKKAASASAHAYGPGSSAHAYVSLRPPLLPPVKRIDWHRCLSNNLGFIFNHKETKEIASENREWWLWRQIYIVDPAGFRLIGELHNDMETGESYYSARYNFSSGAYSTFHIYGLASGTRFEISKVTWTENGRLDKSSLLWIHKRRAL